jgi:hypothetical protein
VFGSTWEYKLDGEAEIVLSGNQHGACWAYGDFERVTQ